MAKLPALAPKEFASTRNYIQDVAKVVGKVQQAFLPADINEWHKGLEINKSGLISQFLNNSGLQIGLDFKKALVLAAGKKWRLGEVPPRQLLKELGEWADQNGAGRGVDVPELTTKTPKFDKVQAKNLATVFSFIKAELENFSQLIPSGTSSPILLYPHHFDISLSWFLNRKEPSDADKTQYTFGFSTGDNTIKKPYFYATAYPESRQFKAINLLEPAYWQKQDFTGAILLYEDAVDSYDATKTLEIYLKTILDALV